MPQSGENAGKRYACEKHAVEFCKINKLTIVNKRVNKVK